MTDTPKPRGFAAISVLIAFALLEKDGVYALAGSVLFFFSLFVVAGVMLAPAVATVDLAVKGEAFVVPTVLARAVVVVAAVAVADMAAVGAIATAAINFY